MKSSFAVCDGPKNRVPPRHVQGLTVPAPVHRWCLRRSRTPLVQCMNQSCRWQCCPLGRSRWARVVPVGDVISKRYTMHNEKQRTFVHSWKSFHPRFYCLQHVNFYTTKAIPNTTPITVSEVIPQSWTPLNSLTHIRLTDHSVSQIYFSWWSADRRNWILSERRAGVCLGYLLHTGFHIFPILLLRYFYTEGKQEQHKNHVRFGGLEQAGIMVTTILKEDYSWTKRFWYQKNQRQDVLLSKALNPKGI